MREEQRRGEKITSSLPNIPQMQFVFDYEEREGDEILLYGSVYFQGNEYIGVIVTNNNGNLIGFDFQIAELNYDESEVTNLLDDAEGLEHELSVFFEDDVIPTLM